jgi:hypothetical protein
MNPNPVEITSPSTAPSLLSVSKLWQICSDGDATDQFVVEQFP